MCKYQKVCRYTNLGITPTCGREFRSKKLQHSRGKSLVNGEKFYRIYRSEKCKISTLVNYCTRLQRLQVKRMTCLSAVMVKSELDFPEASQGLRNFLFHRCRFSAVLHPFIRLPNTMHLFTVPSLASPFSAGSLPLSPSLFLFLLPPQKFTVHDRCNNPIITFFLSIQIIKQTFA